MAQPLEIVDLAGPGDGQVERAGDPVQGHTVRRSRVIEPQGSAEQRRPVVAELTITGFQQPVSAEPSDGEVVDRGAGAAQRVDHHHLRSQRLTLRIGHGVFEASPDHGDLRPRFRVEQAECRPGPRAKQHHVAAFGKIECTAEARLGERGALLPAILDGQAIAVLRHDRPGSDIAPPDALDARTFDVAQVDPVFCQCPAQRQVADH